MGKNGVKQKASAQSSAPAEPAIAAGPASNQSITTVDTEQSASNPGLIADCDAAIKEFERGSR